MDFRTITFYRYVNIKDPKELRSQVKKFCLDHGILGRVLIATEGINGAVSGTSNEIKTFQQWIENDKRFKDLTYRKTECDQNAYHKLVVRVRKEIVALYHEVDINQRAPYIEPEELKKQLDNNDDIVLIDMRNDYEYDVGHFKGAVEVPMKNFRDLPEFKEMLEQYKDKTVVTYCTGGIRCEKASAYLVENGHSNVKQLHGGIIEFIRKFPNTHFKGSCFTFDDFLSLKQGDDHQPIGNCSHCGSKTDSIINCHNIDCDTLFVCCDKCEPAHHSCCSKECEESPKQRKKFEKKLIVGKVLNYYPKANVAHISLDRGVLKKDMQITIKGRTTKLKAIITELRDEEGNAINKALPKSEVTFPVSDRVRENDEVCVVYG